MVNTVKTDTRRVQSRSPSMLALLLAAPLAPPPAAHATGVRQLVSVSDFSGLSASPDGRYVVFRVERADIEENSYRLQWHAVETETGAVREIGSGGDPIYADPGAVEEGKPLWLPEGATFVFPALTNQAIGIWNASVDGSSMTPLVVRDEDVESISLSNDGKALLYKVGPTREEIRRSERSEYDTGILVDSSVDLAQNLFRGGSINGRMASQRLVGYWYVRSGLLWRSPRQLRRFDLQTLTDSAIGEPVAVPPFQPPAITAAASAVSSGGDRAEATWDGESGSVTARLGGDPQPVTCRASLCTTGRVSALAWRPGTRQLMITITDRHRRQSIYLWDAVSGELRLVIHSDGLLSGGRRNFIPCAATNSAAYCVASGAASPPQLVRIDFDSGSSTIVFDPNSALRSAYSAKVEHLSWKTGSGISVAGTILTPARVSLRSAPLFINYYACDGFLRGGEGDEWPIPSLLTAGFVVACVNAAPMKGPQDALANYRTGVEAIRALVALLEKRGLVDRRKVAMGGFSFGSEVAMRAAAHSDLLAAVSIASSQTEPASYWTSTMTGGDHARLIRSVWGLGPPGETPSRWKLVSPALNAKRIRAPILFQLPEQEARRIPELYARLNRAGLPTELHAFPDEAHIKVQPRHRLAVYERNLDWFRYWIQGYRAPDPEKVGQYGRWDMLKGRWEMTPHSSAP